MAKLTELRQKSQALREAVQRERAERIRESVQNVVQSDSFSLSIVDAGVKLDSDASEVAKQIADQITEEVCSNVLNPVNDFIDTCRARNMTDTRIKKTVKTLNKVFGLTASEDYEEQLEAVALYMSNNVRLYDDIAAFN